MLGKTAGGLFWMFRYLERAESTARLIDAGFRIALTRSAHAEDEWASVIDTACGRDVFLQAGGHFDGASVTNFLLRHPDNPSSVVNVIEAARTNARLVRTALTREVWEAVNETWMILKERLARPVRETELPDTLAMIRKQSALVRGATAGSMLRNDIYSFARLGTYLERADYTARILDVKYYVLLPSTSLVGSPLDNVQWETILRSAGGERAFHWLYGGESRPMMIADFLILDARMPRSLKFCIQKAAAYANDLCTEYSTKHNSLTLLNQARETLNAQSIDIILDTGLHEFLVAFNQRNSVITQAIEKDFRFNE